MIPSVNPEVDRELTEGAVHYATEGNKKLTASVYATRNDGRRIAVAGKI